MYYYFHIRLKTRYLPYEIQEYTIANKIIVTTKGVFLPISKLHFIFTWRIRFLKFDISQICYYCRISLQSVVVNSIFLTILHLWALRVTFILLAMAHPIWYHCFMHPKTKFFFYTVKYFLIDHTMCLTMHLTVYERAKGLRSQPYKLKLR